MRRVTEPPADFGPLVSFARSRVDRAGEVRPLKAASATFAHLVDVALAVVYGVSRRPLQIALVPPPGVHRDGTRPAACALAAVEEAPAVEPAGLPRHAGTAAALSTSAAAHSSCGVSARSATPSATVRA